MTRARAVAVALLVGLSPATPGAAHAWNDHGHMTVAAVAYRLLTPAARDRAAALLRLNPDYARWIAGAPSANRDAVAFLRASTWPDAIKHDPRYANDGDRPDGAAARQNLGYGDRLQHRYWHFIDLPFVGADKTGDWTRDQALTRSPAANVQTQIAAFREVLGSQSASSQLKSYDLVWLLHLVGDVHQPLHCASRIDPTQPMGDRGGNAVLLCAAPCTDVLHGFWDAAIGGSEDPADALAQAAALAAADPALAALPDEATWIAESFAAVGRSVYVAPIREGAGPFTLDAHYRNEARRVALARVALAGARLARLLNLALDETRPGNPDRPRRPSGAVPTRERRRRAPRRARPDCGVCASQRAPRAPRRGHTRSQACPRHRPTRRHGKCFALAPGDES